MRGRHPPTRWRVSSASDDAASLVPPELDALADASSVETVDPTVAHVDEAARVVRPLVPRCGRRGGGREVLPEAARHEEDEAGQVLRARPPQRDGPRGRRRVRGAFGARVRERLRAVTGRDLRCGDFPVEARLYLPGAEMAWHRDVRLYATPQFELILTVSNTSDARTQWVGSDGAARSIRPAPNSALLFVADGAWHRVVPASQGERVIVKALYCPDASLAKTPAFGECLEEAPWRR